MSNPTYRHEGTRCRACEYSTTPFCAKHEAESRNASATDAHGRMIVAGVTEMMIAKDRDSLAAIDDHERSVSAWESKFIASCMERLDNGQSLTNKQRAKSREILERLND